MLTVNGETVVGLAGWCDGGVGAQAIAFDRRTGERRWATSLPGSAETSRWPGTADGGVAVFGTAVGELGEQGPTTIYAVDVRDGSERWRRAMPGGLIDPSVSGSVIVGRLSPQELIGLDRATGGERWRRQLEDEEVAALSNSGSLILIPPLAAACRSQPRC
jgi:outer membrane protein assembly factor BamB